MRLSLLPLPQVVKHRRRQQPEIRLVCLILALLGCLGCRHVEPGFYPIGLYGVRSINDFLPLRAAGFNAIQGEAGKNYLDAAQAARLKVMASPGTSAGEDFDPVAARHAVAAFDPIQPCGRGISRTNSTSITSVRNR